MAQRMVEYDGVPPAHYVIFHPENKREPTRATALALMTDGAVQPWEGTIWMDKPPGNEDPLVLVEPWVFSYCHATQLRRRIRKHNPYIKNGSYLIFCNGQAADLATLQVDTVFVVGHRAIWPDASSGTLPAEFGDYFEKQDSLLWMSHLRYGLTGHHPAVYTYQAQMWEAGRDHFSFLPISKGGERVSIPIESLSSTAAVSINNKVRGKYPAELSVEQVREVLSAITTEAHTRVVRNIRVDRDITNETKAC